MSVLTEFIEALEPEPYHLDGSIVSGDPGSCVHPFECDCEFTSDAEGSVIEGSCTGLHAAPVAFRVKIEFEATSPHAASVQVTTQGLRGLQGKLLFFGGKVTFIGRVHSGALSAQITFERGRISVAGAFTLDHHYYAYSLRGGLPARARPYPMWSA